MDIEPSYIHPSHSDSPSSGHYAEAHVRRDIIQSPSSCPSIKQEVSIHSTEVSINVKQEPEPVIITKQEEPISTPVPQQAVAAPVTSKVKSDDSYFTCRQPQQHGTDTTTTTTRPDETSHSSTFTPAMYLAKRDKRKSSPAVLGLLGLGEEEEAKLTLHLSQHRNSIEAAMLLANFNRPQIKSTPELEKKTTTTWKDTMSVDSNPDRKTTSYSYWDDAVQATRQRRYSFDGKLSWNTMSREFLEQASLLQELKVKPIKLPSNTSSLTSSPLSSPRIRSTTWYSESMEQHHQQQQQQQHPFQHPHQQHYTLQHPSQPYPHPHMQHHPAVYHPMYSSGHPLAAATTANNNNDQQQQPSSPMSQQPPQQQGLPFPLPPPGYYPYPYPQSQQPYYFPGKLPLLSNGVDSNSSNGNTSNGSNGSNGNGSSGLIIHPYHPPPPHPSMAPHLHPLHPAQQHHHPMSHHHHHQHLQHLQQSHAMAAAATAAPPVKPKRKRRDQTDDEENLGHVMPGDADFPDMAERDVEAARNDVEARPRRQKLRYMGDMYTPQWVRYNGQSKEGLCDTCKPGKWLQLKNSAFWYHKQFFHGISSVSGAEFMKPMDTRWVDQDIVEGLCHQCQQWVSVSNVKRKNSVLWYRHAHKCHVYHKPKNGSPKRR